MNEASQWRQNIAHRLTFLYAHKQHVAAVLLGGSSARGHADQYSDIELGVFWHQPPIDEERGSIIDLAGGDLIRLYSYDAQEEVWEDDFMMGRATPEQAQNSLL